MGELYPDTGTGFLKEGIVSAAINKIRSVMGDLKENEYITWRAFLSTIIALLVLIGSIFGAGWQMHQQQPHVGAVTAAEYERDQRRLQEQLELMSELFRERSDNINKRLDAIIERLNNH